MISKVRRASVIKSTEDVVRDLNLTSLPVSPTKIAGDKGITVQSWKPTKKGISGFLMKRGDAFGIGYSGYIENPGFINFTVGHELGHYFLDGHVERLFANGEIHYSQSGFFSDEDCEKEADLFSANLLMPEALFRKAMATCGEGFEAIERLAGLCETSITATAIRYAEFAENTVAIIVSDGQRVDFCSLSDNLRERSNLTWLKRGDLVPESSATGKIGSAAERISSGAKINAFTTLDEWLEGAPRVEVKEDAVGLGHYGKVLTVLFTDEDIDVEEEDEEEWKPRWGR